MGKKTLIHINTLDEVRDLYSKVKVFSTKLPSYIQEYFVRDIIDPIVIENVVSIWNKSNDVMEVDAYLLDAGECTQEEREEIIESLYNYKNN